MSSPIFSQEGVTVSGRVVNEVGDPVAGISIAIQPFGNRLYWIGLSDAEKEGEWVWENGEPLTYENWGTKHNFPRSTLSPEEKDSAVMTFVNGQWHAVGPSDLFWRMTRMAILEKEIPRTGEAAKGE